MTQELVWFNLSRYHMGLGVMPKTPYRPAMMVIKFLNTADASFALARDIGAEGDFEAASNHWKQWCTQHDFKEGGNFPWYDTDGERRWGRFFVSPISRLALSDMQMLLPGLTRADAVPTPKSDITFRPLDVIGYDVPTEDLLSKGAAAWSAFSRNVLSHVNVGLWFDRREMTIKPWEQSAELSVDDRNRMSFRLGCPNGIEQLRDNALLTAYATQDAAVSAGIPAEHLARADFPFSLPLRHDPESGSISLLRDVRHWQTLLGMDPESVFRQARSVTAPTGYMLGRPLLEHRQAFRLVQAPLANFLASLEAGTVTPEQLAEGRLVIPQAITKLGRLASAGRPSSDDDLDQFLELVMAEGKTTLATAIRNSELVNPEEFVLVTPWHEIWDQARFGLISHLGLDTSARKAVYRGMDSLAAAHAEQLQRDAQALAARELERAANESRSKVSRDDRVVHVDAGEKIGGARKDFHLRALDLSDLANMNDVERNALVVKNNIWPPLDYRAMREAGYEPKAAFAIKAIKDAISTDCQGSKIGRSRTVGSEPEVYIAAVAKVRDALSGIKTYAALPEAMYHLYWSVQGYERGAYPEPGDSPAESFSVYSFGGSDEAIALGRKFGGILSSAVCSKWVPGNASRFEIDSVSPLRQELRKKMPDSKTIYNGSDFVVTEFTDEDHWSVLIKTSKKKSEAELDAAAAAKERDRLLHRPHLEKVVREGTDWRASRDITAADLMETFGFRAVEFGNWLPQDERQEVLNFAYDSFYDLAQALSLPPNEMSLGGDLAIAFGSRGTGGKGAALAHFEPARNVINLTRLNGAGSLAHEWFHARDWSLGDRQAFLSEKIGSDMKSNAEAMAVHSVVHAMRICEKTLDQAISESRAKFEKHVEYAISWAKHRLPSSDGENRQELAEQFSVDMKALANKMLESRLKAYRLDLPEAVKLGNGAACQSDGKLFEAKEEFLRVARDAAQKLNKEARTQLDLNTGSWTRAMESLAMLTAFQEFGLAEDRQNLSPYWADVLKDSLGRTNTPYLAEAEKLDKLRSSPYWATTLELWARAGAAYVSDKLAALGTRSDYLVYGAEEDRHSADPGNPNPTGATRQAVNAAFDDLMAAHRLRLASEAEARRVSVLGDDELLEELQEAASAPAP